MSSNCRANAREYFDEKHYLTSYPDVARAVSEGEYPDGFTHYLKFGAEEGRDCFRFDGEWYAESYPLVKVEIEAGLATSPIDHFLNFGSARGYLPRPRAVRPNNAAALKEVFGGLWIDAPNARDLILGKKETLCITEKEAGLLHHFWKDGYVILRQAVPPELLRASRDVLEQAYGGKFPDMLFECHSVCEDKTRWNPEINKYPAKSLDIHMFSNVVLDLIFAPAILRFLGLLFESLPLGCQTLGFLRGSAQSAHQDSAFVPFSIPRQFAASWIALEDVAPGAGELFYYPGSHRLNDFTYGGRFKSVREAVRNGIPIEETNKMVDEHVGSLPARAEREGLRKESFLARAGDILIWHADLVHGGLPVSAKATRKSIVTHYCPRFHIPLFMEDSKCDAFNHHSGSLFTSHIYRNMLPLA